MSCCGSNFDFTATSLPIGIVRPPGSEMTLKPYKKKSSKSSKTKSKASKGKKK